MAEEDVQEPYWAEASNLTISPQRLGTLNADAGLRATAASNPAAPTHVLEHLAQDGDSLVRQAVASNPTTPVNLLEALANDCWEVRRAVAGNPNTPWPLLEQLAVVFPKEFLSNPGAPLQMLAHSEQIRTDDLFWGILLQEADIPSLWWDWLQSHPTLKVSQAVCLHVQYAGETIFFAGTLQKEHAPIVLTLTELLLVASAHRVPTLPASTLMGETVVPCEQVVKEHLWWLARQSDKRIRAAVAGNAQAPEEVLRILAQDEDWQIREAVTQNVQVPVEILRTLAQDQALGVRQGVARHPQTPVEVLRELAKQAQTPVEVLRVLVYNKGSWARYYMAENAQMPVEILRTLAQEQDLLVQEFVAGHVQAPVELLRMLAQDREAVRVYVAGNPQTPVELLRMLAQDEDSYVRQAVAENPQTPGEVLCMLAQDEHEDDEVRRAATGNVQMPLETLHMLAQDRDEGVRQVVAWNTQTPGEVLQALSQDSCADVRYAATVVQRLLAEIGETSRQQGWWQDLRTLLWTLDREYELTAGKTVEERISGIVKLNASEPLCEIILETLAVDWNAALIRNAFSGKVRSEGYAPIMALFMPPIVLQQLAASPSWEVRYLVALHERTPQNIRQHLGQGGNRYVRTIARAKAVQMGEAALSA